MGSITTYHTTTFPISHIQPSQNAIFIVWRKKYFSFLPLLQNAFWSIFLAPVLRNGSIPKLIIWQVTSSAAGKIFALLFWNGQNGTWLPILNPKTETRSQTRNLVYWKLKSLFSGLSNLLYTMDILLWWCIICCNTDCTSLIDLTKVINPSSLE